MSVRLFLICYFLLLNFITFGVFALDKKKAVNHEFRVPEAVLFILALLGGSAGALAAMFILRHKNRKPAFFIGIPAILLGQVLLLVICLRSFSVSFIN
ncbi:MAG: DUF1294 domain-containing protein [Lachnospiraceae bacterium]|jgi:uncharacterized membrane protein YsdA (DUF1294 family)|nr:DUF1294 domain-containing protein [Lachnospiraceae bacterium]